MAFDCESREAQSEDWDRMRIGAHDETYHSLSFHAPLSLHLVTPFIAPCQADTLLIESLSAGDNGLTPDLELPTPLEFNETHHGTAINGTSADASAEGSSGDDS